MMQIPLPQISPRREMLDELIQDIGKNPSEDPNPNYYYKKYGERILPGEKYSKFGGILSALEILAKRRLLQQNPNLVFWDSNKRAHKTSNSFYARAGVDKKLEEMLRINPNAQINVDEFSEMLGYEKGKKLTRYERMTIRSNLHYRIKIMTKRLGIIRNPPRGCERLKKEHPNNIIRAEVEQFVTTNPHTTLPYKRFAAKLGHHWDRLNGLERTKLRKRFNNLARKYAMQKGIKRTIISPVQARQITRRK
ncbi:MAG: hypothetical protein NTY48_00380 [Candidatus Diapherotrites archaeon]|nr:hypothetical protein [Candidatus Diapherotrites archaeon]